MLKTEQLGLYLDQYRALPLHHNPELKKITLGIMDWQKQRMQNLHLNLFTATTYSTIQEFFFSHFYNFEALELLAQQLQQALKEKIKLDRWLPNELLDTILMGFHLALITLQTDSKLAELLIKNDLELSTENILAVLPDAEQNQIRVEQLDLLNDVSKKMLKFAHSFLFRSALRLAKPKIEQRGFSALNHYIEDGLKAMRSHKKSQIFFQHLVYQEKLFLDYLTIQQPRQLNIYYDAEHDRLVTFTQPDKDACIY